MVKKVIFIVFLLVGTAVTAQIPLTAEANVFPKEKISISYNSEVLLAGELLQYKTYCLTEANTKSELSKLIYVSMRNQQDSVIFNQKLKLENGTANGDFFIPSNLKTGVYKLIGYTNNSKNNKEDAFAQENIFIVNTFLKNNVATKTIDTVYINPSANTVVSETNTTGASEMVKFTLNKQKFGLREKVSLNVEAAFKSSEGSYVLSVRKVNPLTTSGTVLKASSATPKDVFYIPELRGELISGLVLSKSTNTPIANKEVSLTIPGSDFVFKIAKTNTEGRFFFSVNESYDAQKSIVQLYGDAETRNDYDIVLDKKEFALSPNSPNYLKLNPDLKDWLKERSVQLQVENAYFEVKKDSVLTNKTNPRFYNDLGTVFLLDDYTRFPSVRETFIEIITLAAIRGNASNSRFVVNNEYDPNGIAKFNHIDPLVLMDGMLIQDNEELINYNAHGIESIRVITEPYRYGAKIFSGIIAVETKKGDYKSNTANDYVSEIDLLPLVKNKQYYSPDYSVEKTLSRIPDYRVQLLWDATVKLETASHSVTFYTSDVVGTYEVSLEGYNKNGKRISSKEYFKVVED